jgi:transcriptional regulator with XRE-family HTH domain
LENEQTIIVGKIIEKLRRKQLLSQEDLADFSQKDRHTISDLERDQYNPSLGTIYKLAAALDMKPSGLVREIEEVEGNAQFYKELLREVEEKRVMYKKNRRSR